MDREEDIKSIVKKYLIQHGYDGLHYAEISCGCDLEDLMPCRTPSMTECLPGLRVAGCSDQCGEGCDFHITSEI